MKLLSIFVVLAAPTTAAHLRRSDSCAAEDLAHRAQLQNKLAGDCEEMCKEVGAYPDKCTCPGFVAPDKTPGVMTWEELLQHMDNLVAWGKDSLKGWTAQAASALQKHVANSAQKAVVTSKTCAAEDLNHRVQIQNHMASACIDMCKELGAYPDCECPDFVKPDSTPGVMTWDELLEHMDNLVGWSVEMSKKWKARAGSASLIQLRDVPDDHNAKQLRELESHGRGGDVPFDMDRHDLPHQGYDEYYGGKLVTHSNGETFSGDWQREWPQVDLEAREHIANICAENPRNEWCKMALGSGDSLAHSH